MRPMWTRCAAAVLAFAMASGSAGAASLSRSYAYFPVYGKTAEQLERDLARRGPKVSGSREGHPGATELRFKGKVDYAMEGGVCVARNARYHVSAKIILPRWKQRRGSERDLVFVWDTLSRDIKRHEEQHVIIAKRHAREIEQRIERLRPAKDCETLERKAEAIVSRVMDEHDRDQARFDRAEAAGFDSRMKRLMRYYLEQQDRVETK